MRDDLADQPPSVKLVYLVLDHEGPCTLADLKTETRLPYRTVRYALERLMEAGVVTERPHFRDARKRVYTL